MQTIEALKARAAEFTYTELSEMLYIKDLENALTDPAIVAEPSGARMVWMPSGIGGGLSIVWVYPNGDAVQGGSVSKANGLWCASDGTRHAYLAAAKLATEQWTRDIFSKLPSKQA